MVLQSGDTFDTWCRFRSLTPYNVSLSGRLRAQRLCHADQINDVQLAADQLLEATWLVWTTAVLHLKVGAAVCGALLAVAVINIVEHLIELAVDIRTAIPAHWLALFHSWRTSIHLV